MSLEIDRYGDRLTVRERYGHPRTYIFSQKNGRWKLVRFNGERENLDHSEIVHPRTRRALCRKGYDIDPENGMPRE